MAATSDSSWFDVSLSTDIESDSCTTYSYQGADSDQSPAPSAVPHGAQSSDGARGASSAPPAPPSHAAATPEPAIVAEQLGVDAIMRNKACAPEATAGLLSRVTYSWMTNLMRLGARRPLQAEDMLPNAFVAPDSHAALESAWAAEQARAAASLANPRMDRALVQAFGYDLWTGFPAMLVFTVAQLLMTVFFLGRLLDFLPDRSQPTWHGVLYALGMFLCSVLSQMCTHWTFYVSVRAGIKALGGVQHMVYSKVLTAGLGSASVGTAMSLATADAFSVFMAFAFGHFTWWSVLYSLLVLAVLLSVIGPAAIPGFVLMLSVVPVQLALARLIGRYRAASMAVTDQRTRLMAEILGAIKVIKLYAWEEPFTQRVAAVRAEEKVHLRKGLIVKNLNVAFAFLMPVLCAFTTFAVYTGAGNRLTTRVTFVTLALFALLRFPLIMVPLASKSVIEAYVGSKRLRVFCEAPDSVEKDQPSSERAFARLTRGSFDFRSRETVQAEAAASGRPVELLLRDVDLFAKRGELVAIVGSVGSGKTALLAALLGQIDCHSGSADVQGTIAYVPQQAWCPNDSIRGNILFGLPYDEERYRNVLRLACLETDLALFDAGDATEIGERGINLSGGQRQRVALARALYANRDVYLLDDPLSAVDAHVGRMIFEGYIRGALADKCVVMVTNQLQFLPAFTRIYVLADHTISESGSYAALVANNGAFARMLRQHALEETHVGSHSDDGGESVGSSVRVARRQARAVKAMSASASIVGGAAPADVSQPAKVGAKLVEDEDRAVGAVTWATYKAYGAAAGSGAVLYVVVAIFALVQLTRMLSDWWLSFWIQDNGGRPDGQHLGIYALFLCMLVLALGLREVLWSYFALEASTRLHNTTFLRVLRAPMAFFDSNPLGRILSRFSKDIAVLDDELTFSMYQALQWALHSMFTALLIAIVLPYFIPVLVGIVYLFARVQAFYRRTTRELKRLENNSRSPLAANLASTLSGIATIRAYRSQERYAAKNTVLFDEFQRALLAGQMAQRWVGLRLDMLSALVVFSAALFAALSRSWMPAALAALAVVYALQLAGTFQWMVRVSAETEAHMTSVERLCYYSNTIDQEAPPRSKNERAPPPAWPQRGAISFESVCLAYRPGLPLVLRDVSVRIEGGQKIGIVGRSGGGKSTLSVALYRLVELASGRILIDGLDIAQLGLTDLRSKLSLIPQEPVLFRGSVRENLDPFNAFSDEDVHRAVERAHMHEVIAAMPENIYAPVEENGSNFSVGERQLLCLARALLRNSRILILDEATAACDADTDAKIQQTIRSSFNDCTLLIVAHRLNTVMDVDRILVMDAGRLVEFDSPLALLDDKHSNFYALVQQTGEANARYLYSLAHAKKFGL